MRLPDFRLETHFSKWEFKAEHHLTASDADSHAIVVTPNHQSHETLPVAICEATGVPLDPDDWWSLDIDRVAAAVRPNTRLITIDFLHSPTGAILPRDRYDALIELCRHLGLYILHDGIFNGLGPTGTEHLPFIADVYERGLALNVASKAYGLGCSPTSPNGPALMARAWVSPAAWARTTHLERTR